METVLIGSVISALATGIGAIPILFFKNMSHLWRDVLLAFTAGVMVSAATFSLLPTAFESSNIWVVLLGVFVGTYTLTTLEKNIPHIDIQHTSGIEIDQKAMLVVAAITLHNIPEGLSVGVSYASGENGLGGLVALAIGLQNAPEGLLVALFLVQQQVKKTKAFLIATATGAIEIVTSLLGYVLAGYTEALVPYGLSFAAGAMLFIVYKELIPESHGDGNERFSTYSFIFGLLMMFYLTTIFG